MNTPVDRMFSKKGFPPCFFAVVIVREIKSRALDALPLNSTQALDSASC